MLRFLLFSMVLALLPLSVQASPPKVYPVKQVIGFDESSRSQNATAFDLWVKTLTLPKLNEEFVTEFKKEFGEIAIDDISATSRNKVLVASLHLIRTSQYVVPKELSKSTEYHLPITLSIQLTNPATGEVLYSFTRTSYAPVEVHDSEKNTPQCDLLLRNATTSNYRGLLLGLIKEAKRGYNPIQTEASVAKIWKKMAILDKGSKFGIAKNDSLEDAQGNMLHVLYVDENYSVGNLALGAYPAIGSIFSKYSNQDTAKAVKKPRVLTMLKGWEDKELIAISRYFDSELSKESAFTLLPVNESLATVLQSVAENTNIGKNEITNRREMPDYLIKFSFAEPRVYDVVQEGRFGFKIYEQYVLGELLDKQGRIVYSAIGSNRIEDKDVGGMVFSKDARLEVLLKNATVHLAEQFSKSIKFSSSTFPVTGVIGNIVDLQDPSRVLRPNQNTVLYKNIGEVGGISGDVLVPIWEATVIDNIEGKTRIELLAALTNELSEIRISKGDVVLLNSLTTGKESENANSVTYCKDIPSKLGTVDIDDFSVISRGFGYLLPYALYDNDMNFRTKVQSSIQYGGFKQSSLKLGSVDTEGRCLQPIHKVTIESRQGNYCNLSLAIGYRLYVGQEKKGAAASKSNLTLNDVQEDVLNPTIQCEVSKNALGQLKDNIMKLQYQ